MSSTATNPARWVSGDRLTGVAMLAAGAAALYAGWKVYRAVTWARAEIQETADENPGGMLDALRTDFSDPEQRAAFCERDPNDPNCQEVGLWPNWDWWQSAPGPTWLGMSQGQEEQAQDPEKLGVD